MFSQKQKQAKLFQTLANERQMTSLMEKEVVAGIGDFVYDRANWVSLYYDTGRRAHSDDGTQVAYRAITTDGQLLWYVKTDGKAHMYHSLATCPFEAFEEANAAIAKRRSVKSGWADVQAHAWRLATFRERHDVLIKDAYASPLCPLGIQSFLRSVGIGKAKRIPGFLAGWLMLIDPQLGFVIHEARLRHGIAAPLEASIDASLTPAG